MDRPHDILNYPMVAASITTHWWLPSIENVSQFCGIVTPILIVVWWSLQIGLKVKDYKKRGKR